MKTYRTESIAAGFLFITATAATMAAQMLLEPMLAVQSVPAHIAENRLIFVAGALLELTNALASCGIAIAFYPIIWVCRKSMATAYLGLRLLEAGLGLFAVVALLSLLTPIDAMIGAAFHEWGFQLVLIVFSIGTFVFYPVLYKFRLVPAILSVWGIIGGSMLLISCLLIVLGQIKMGSGHDLFLSLPIWINEMALALWLIFRGVDLSSVR